MQAAWWAVVVGEEVSDLDLGACAASLPHRIQWACTRDPFSMWKVAGHSYVLQNSSVPTESNSTVNLH